MIGTAPRRLLWWVLPVLVLVAGLWLAYVILTLTPRFEGPAGKVAQNLDVSGVVNPVTAVLINFRGYDTLLEMAVLLVAMLGVWSLGGAPKLGVFEPGPVLGVLVRCMVPLLILVAAYLLWSGAHAPGGAFQAGSVLGAVGVILLLARWPVERGFYGVVLRLLLCLGLCVFAGVGAATVLAGRAFLQYPPSLAGGLILLIETAATLSIAITLAGLFLGGKPASEPV